MSFKSIINTYQIKLGISYSFKGYFTVRIASIFTEYLSNKIATDSVIQCDCCFCVT